MAEAKNLEVQTWLEEMVCLSYRGIIPAGRLMNMRWVLTLKGIEGSPDKAECKAGIVPGFIDPGLLELPTSAPTMSRRSRQLVLGLATHRHWQLHKADAKAAFLQRSLRERGCNGRIEGFCQPWMLQETGARSVVVG